ncbi:hypothetical protein [Winogradskyella psychrotolerans]|uniref:hypothetical protein n=1 Tax=Winogradskyella psychrotolerans TaxID=1344585 RepID=UPI001C07CF61|nr:hypothetical protein [Winogradskyella psychrotolerans]MBU2928028.1 hypothetical protein [Winogradskyella psychrotolerans]
MSDFIVSDDIKKYVDKECIDVSLDILKTLKGKSHFEVKEILRTVNSLSELNSHI